MKIRRLREKESHIRRTLVSQRNLLGSMVSTMTSARPVSQGTWHDIVISLFFFSFSNSLQKFFISSFFSRFSYPPVGVGVGEGLGGCKGMKQRGGGERQIWNCGSWVRCLRVCIFPFSLKFCFLLQLYWISLVVPSSQSDEARMRSLSGRFEARARSVITEMNSENVSEQGLDGRTISPGRYLYVFLVPLSLWVFLSLLFARFNPRYMSEPRFSW